MSSYLRGYRGIPSYDAIVALGPPVVPYIVQTLRDNKDDEDMLDILADTIVEIKKWDRNDYGGRVGATRREVLERLDAAR